MDDRKNLRELPLIYPVKDKAGDIKHYRIVGTKNELFLDSPPERLQVEPTFIVSPYALKPTIMINHHDKTLEANCLLIGKKTVHHGVGCREAYYCRLKEPII